MKRFLLLLMFCSSFIFGQNNKNEDYPLYALNSSTINVDFTKKFKINSFSEVFLKYKTEHPKNIELNTYYLGDNSGIYTQSLKDFAIQRINQINKICQSDIIRRSISENFIEKAEILNYQIQLNGKYYTQFEYNFKKNNTIYSIYFVGKNIFYPNYLTGINHFLADKF